MFHEIAGLGKTACRDCVHGRGETYLAKAVPPCTRSASMTCGDTAHYGSVLCGTLHVCAAKGGQGGGAEQRKLRRADAPHPHASSKLVAPSARPPQCRASELRLASAQPRPRMGEVTVFKANSLGVHLYV